jgi:hypothetical protein
VIHSDEERLAPHRVQFAVQSQHFTETDLRPVAVLSGIAHALSMWATESVGNPPKV